MDAYLGICAIVKDENDYLLEWIGHHRAVGVERFTIYDNGSQVPVRETLAREIDERVVEVIEFPGRCRQLAAYTDYVRRMKCRAFWTAFIDADEFLVPRTEDSLVPILRRFEGHGALAVHWRLFGSSGHQTRPAGLQMEAFTLGSATQWKGNAVVKTVARADLVLRVSNVHVFEYRPGSCCVNERGALVGSPRSLPVTSTLVQLNHYYLRSRQEWEEKCRRGRADTLGGRNVDFDEADPHLSTEKDESILRFAPMVRRYIEERR